MSVDDKVDAKLIFVAQMVSQATVNLTVDGLDSAHAQKLVVAGLSVERAAILRLQMAAVIV